MDKQKDKGADDTMEQEVKFKVPHWKTYKIEGIREFEKVERLLAARQLRDPWTRNEVWRYTKENYRGQYRNAAVSLGRGLKWAVLAMGVTLTLDAMGWWAFPKEHHKRAVKEIDDDDEDW